MRLAFGPAAVVLASLLLIGGAAEASAQDRQESLQQSSSQVPNRSADFLFGRPRASIGVRGHWIFASAGSDIFDFVTRQLTLDKKDFDGPGFGADGGVALNDRLDVVGGFEMSRMSKGSEYRDFVDNLLLPIEQRTSLNTLSIVGSVRYALIPKGQQISRLAWIPNRVVPYVGAGAGATHYEFRQSGDFVDFQDLSVFNDSFKAAGWTPTAHVFGGVDVQLFRGLYCTAQGRYTKAKGTLSSDFIDFDPIDLSGFRVSAGINLLF